jgi:hypothetical protein
MDTNSNLIESFPLTIRKTLQKYTRLPQNISNTFYHFTTHEGIEGIIRNGGIRATYRKHMNDNKEFEYSKDIIYKAMANIENRSDLPKLAKDISKQVKQNLEIHFNDTAKMSSSFCSCLTRSSDDKKQWKKYAEEGRGFALGFNLLQILTRQYPKFQTNRPLIFCNPVIYDKTAQLNLVTDLMIAGVKDLKNFADNCSQRSEDLTKLRDRITAAIFVDLFTISNFMKSETLSFEREMRLFYSTTDLTVSQLNVQYYKIDSISLPFVLMDMRDTKTKRLPLSEITIGPKASFDREKDFLNDLLDDLGYGNNYNDRPNINQLSAKS